ncbi:MAG: Permease YjgP/YjgQ family protein [Hyphomicrobiales bacterium]|nr:Permease YjgP/YjgQ family protein [Hyphomicrobiales bacterium]
MIGRTLGLYLAGRFTRSILAVFATIFVLIYLIDFVEMLRKAGDAKSISTIGIAGLTLLRVPTVTEQVLPFATLGGAMVAFIGLTRRLELVVARAAGVSVWQFLTPPVLIVLLVGALSVGVYNPLAAMMKQRADAIELSLFGRTGPLEGDSSLWIRQRGAQGQSILRAEQSSDRGAQLGSVSAFVFDLENRFVERVDAARAHLEPGTWVLENGRVTTPGAEPRTVERYLLPTYLSADQVSQSFVTADAVPFWTLPDVSRRTEAAGLDATSYRLKFQVLLARPLLLVAMVLIAASFSLRFFRMGGVARMVSGGVAAGFVLYVVTKLMTDLGGAGILSAPVAAWAPALMGSLLSVLVLLHQEDG